MNRHACPALIAVVALFLAAPAQATSFDCAKASSVVEKMICADPELSQLDDALAASYRNALAQSGDPAALKVAQRQWLTSQRNACIDADCVKAAYRSRQVALTDAPTDFATLAEATRATCDKLAADEPDASPGKPAPCRVVESASFGTLDGETWHYALYCLGELMSGFSNRCSNNGIALFAEDVRTKRVRLFHESADDPGNIYSAPEIYRSGAITILEVPVRMDGTGNFNVSVYYLRRDRRWVRIDASTWEQDLAKRLPKGLEVWKGIWPNLANMTAEANLYQESDGNCCPTGGSASITLKLIGTRLAIDSLTINAYNADD